MRVGVVGSRRRNSEGDRRLVFSLLHDYVGPRPLVVVSGGCKTGADRFAREWCELTSTKLVEHLPNMDPKPHSRIDAINRYYARNKLIAADCDVLIALVARNRTGGTENTIGYARKLDKHVAIF